MTILVILLCFNEVLIEIMKFRWVITDPYEYDLNMIKLDLNFSSL